MSLEVSAGLDAVLTQVEHGESGLGNRAQLSDLVRAEVQALHQTTID